MKEQNYRLGLDLGTNSIGWSALELTPHKKLADDESNGDSKFIPAKIIASGVRIFSDGRNPKNGEPLAVARRTARGMRRRRDRFLARKNHLLNYLIEIGLMPKNEIERKKLELLEPYELRFRALYKELKPEELARAIFHLAQRRGFKSNRKEINQDKASSSDENDAKKPKKETSKMSDDHKRCNLQKAIDENNCQTLGEFLFKFHIEKSLRARGLADHSDFYPTRAMYENEFDKIKNFQQNFQKISEENWQKIREIIFYQRPLKPQDKGFCGFLNIHNLEKNNIEIFKGAWAIELINNAKAKNNSKDFRGLPRAYLALPSYCRFRILSEVNNLKIKNKSTREEFELTSKQREAIINKLNSQKSPVKFASLRKDLGKLTGDKNINFAGDNFEFNLESERRPTIEANHTSALLSEEKYFGDNWHKFSLEKQDEIVEFLLEEDDEKKIEEKALNHWKVSAEQAKNLAKLTINQFHKSAVGNLCKELLRKLCAMIEEKNQAGEKFLYHQAMKDIGFEHSKENNGDGSAEKLPYYAKAIPASVVAVKKGQGSQEEQDFGKIANPTVHSALNNLRKVVNSIIDDYGKPTEIHIELARELKQSKQEKKETEKRQRENKNLNDEAKQKIKDSGYKVSDENITKYKLWKELNPNDCNDRRCIFSDEQISITKLFSHEIEIEHILPFSQTLDDSMANKTLALKSANAFKGNRSPFEAFGSNPLNYKYEEILNRSKNLPRHKRWRFEEKAMEKFKEQNSFLSSQLNDTRYLSKIARQYLSQICDPTNICVGNGKITALLRKNWGLNSILHQNLPQNSGVNLEPEAQDYDPETGEVFAETSQKPIAKNLHKNRGDHRHHAIDAVCIAMTDRKLLQQISRDNARNFDLDRLEINLPSHWNSFREDVKESIEKIIVSHKVDHGVNVQLHDETYYGKLDKNVLVEQGKKKPADCNLVIRVKILSLKKSDIYFIRDENIRKLLLLESEKASSDKDFQERILPEFVKNTGIKRVRLYENNNSILKISHPADNPRFEKIVKTNGNNHIALWKIPSKISGHDFITDVVSNFQMNCPYEIKIGEDGCQFINKEKKFVKNKKNEKNENYEKLKPHPAAKLILRLFKDDIVRLEEDGEEKTVVVKIIKSNSQCCYTPHNIGAVKKDKKDKNENLAENSENNDEKKEKIQGSFYLNEKTLLTKKLRKIFVTPSGKVFDSGPILKDSSLI